MHAFISSYAGQRFRPSVRERIVLASTELVTNATAYGAVSEPIIYDLSANERQAIVTVSNAVTASRLEMLKDRIKAVNDDPEKAYLEQMQRSLSGRMLRSQLGLARLRFEAELSLDMSIKDNVVHVTASCAT